MNHAFAILADLVADGGVVVLSGAGLSTESGIPDYRGESGRRRQGEPMTYQTFVAGPEARQRYWARSHLGWQHIARAGCNAGHRAVARLQAMGLVSGIITQNVDGLHQEAGAGQVVELHGSLHRVRCLSCGERSRRERLDERLRSANPEWDALFRAGSSHPDGDAGERVVINPDGDVALEDELVTSFAVVDCESCGGLLKPDVIFFGENVPRPRVQECFDLTEGAGTLLVLGSSLTVMSGYRFVRRAVEHDIPVAIINQGPTRGDGDALLALDAPLGATLSRLVAEVSVGIPAA